jgi:hypothetical protein
MDAADRRRHLGRAKRPALVRSDSERSVFQAANSDQIGAIVAVGSENHDTSNRVHCAKAHDNVLDLAGAGPAASPSRNWPMARNLL